MWAEGAAQDPGRAAVRSAGLWHLLRDCLVSELATPIGYLVARPESAGKRVARHPCRLPKRAMENALVRRQSRALRLPNSRGRSMPVRASFWATTSSIQ